MAKKPLKPKHSFYIGSVGCHIFENQRTTKEGKDFTSFSVTLFKSYALENGEKDYTNSLGLNDLGNASLLLQKAAMVILG